MLLVAPGVFIGTAADLSDVPGLSSAPITHVLSVDSVDPGPVIGPLGEVNRKWVNVRDEEREDLLTHLDSCCLFLQEAVGGGAALVHCQAGRSRSVAVVTAYLMRTQQLGFCEAYGRLRALKHDVQVNAGFEEQLRLYESMRWQVDTSSPLYKQYRLHKLAQRYPEMPQVPGDLFASDPFLSGSAEVSYRCRKCRRALFRDSSVLSHPVGEGAAAFSHKKPSSLSGGVQCTSYFIEPVRWMEDALLGVMEGQLLCPKCGSKLGSFSWVGVRCSCGRWVNPAFQLHRSRVDQIRGAPPKGGPGGPPQEPEPGGPPQEPEPGGPPPKNQNQGGEEPEPSNKDEAGH